jgi:phosphoglucosamine mutase
MIQSLFGTDGIRRRVGQSPLTIATITKLAHAYAQWLSTQYTHPIAIAVADDTRASAPFIKAAFKTALLPYGVCVYDAGTLSTPALIKLVEQHEHIHGGIMVSASHNPAHDNGIKCIDHTGKKLDERAEQSISALFFSDAIQEPDYTHMGRDIPWTSAAQEYIDIVCGYFKPNLLHGLKIVLDLAHGATHHSAPTIFESLGAHVIALHNEPDGTNINHGCGSLHVSTLQHAVIAHAADVGFAFDGDGDRVIAVNKLGEVKNGDDLLAILAQHPLYKDQPIIVGTLMTNQGLSAHLQQQSRQLLRTCVGDVHVTQALIEHNLLLGGEQSGHIIMRDYMQAADGIFTALRIMEVMLGTHNRLLDTFTPFPQSLINVPVEHKRNLNDPTLDATIQFYKSLLKQGRLVVRYSGTESLLRIMVEEQQLADAHAICTQLAQALQQQLNN